jgi:hypothetical protein
MFSLADRYNNPIPNRFLAPINFFKIPALEGDKDVFEKAQKRAVKMLSGFKGNTYEERLKEVGLLTL